MKTKKISCDVLVVGAGLSGVAAAVTAAAGGARTLLVEQHGFLGGSVIAGMHRHICGLYGARASRTLNPGMARKLTQDLPKASACNRSMPLGKVHVFAFRSQDLQAWLGMQVKSAEDLTVMMSCRVCAVRRSQGMICRVRAQKRGVTFDIFPRAVVDASGEGAVIRLSGAKYRNVLSGRRQLAGFSVRVKGVKDAAGVLPIKVPYHRRFVTYVPLDDRGEGILRLNIPPGRDPLQVKNNARAMFDYFRKTFPEFKDASIVALSPFPVEREGISMQGEYTLTGADVLRGKKFNDAVAKCAWPVELWDRAQGVQYAYLRRGSHYEIPLRCLRSKQIKNLLATGRCISATREALGSARVAGTCITLGEQAGVAARRLSAPGGLS